MRVLLSTYESHGDVESMVPVGQPVRPLVTGATPPTAASPRRAAELVAAQFDTVPAAAEGCDALVATGVMPAGVRL